MQRAIRNSVGGLATLATASYATHLCNSAPDSSYFSSWRAQAEAASVAFNNPEAWKKFPLLHREQLTHNTHLFRFKLDSADQMAGLPVASCLLTKAVTGTKPDGKPDVTIRPYTPTSREDARGHFDLIVKCYPDGAMSKVFAALKVGDEVEMKGPIVKLPYKANMKKEIGMVAGGSGITPMLQVIRAVLDNPDDKTAVSLIFANMTEDDVILKDELDRLASKHASRFRVHYTVDKLAKPWSRLFWNGDVGFVSKDMIAKHMPRPSPDSLVMVCGPPGLMKHLSGGKAKDKSQGELTGLLAEMGYLKDHVFKF